MNYANILLSVSDADTFLPKKICKRKSKSPHPIRRCACGACEFFFVSGDTFILFKNDVGPKSLVPLNFSPQ